MHIDTQGKSEPGLASFQRVAAFGLVISSCAGQQWAEREKSKGVANIPKAILLSEKETATDVSYWKSSREYPLNRPCIEPQNQILKF